MLNGRLDSKSSHTTRVGQDVPICKIRQIHKIANNTMFKCIVTEHFGPFCGSGGYGSITQIGMDRSPAKAVAKAKAWAIKDGKAIRRYVNESPAGAGGGVPIMTEFTLLKNGKVIKQTWD